MKLVQINATCGKGSTGTICRDVSLLLTEAGIENYVLYSGVQSTDPMGIRYADERELRLQALRSRVTGKYGFVSTAMTKRLLNELDRIRPDVVQLHNLHSHNCDLGMLFSWLRETGVKVFWTFHDCWAFTGYCTHYLLSGCEQWKTGCSHCPQRRKFSWFRDRSAELWQAKQDMVRGLDLTLVAPSAWMLEQIQSSFLRSFPARLIPNGIDLSVFRPLESGVRERYGVGSDFLILGVAFDWGRRKGLDVFVDLAQRLGEGYRILLVGTDDRLDRTLPDKIISVHRTADRQELAELYSAADVFLNPTREDTFPTVNMEALACGTPVVTFRIGGSPEAVTPDCGVVLPPDDTKALIQCLRRLREARPFSAEACTARTAAYDKQLSCRRYLDLYQESHSNQSDGNAEA